MCSTKMSSTKDIQTNGIHPEEASTSGRIPNADDNANLNSGANERKGAIPKIKTTKTTKLKTYTKKSLKFNNNIEEEPKRRLKMNRLSNGTSNYIELHKNVNYDVCASEDHSSFNNSELDGRGLNNLDKNIVINMKNVQILEGPVKPIKENLKSDNLDCSSDDDDLFSVSDDGCVYTYKGDQVADLPSSFFNLNTPPIQLIQLPLKPTREQSSSPEMDFLEMDFDPGPSEESPPEVQCPNTNIATKFSSNLQTNGVKQENNKIMVVCTKQPSSNNVTISGKTLELTKEINSKQELSPPPTLLSANVKNLTTESDNNAFHQLYPWFCSISQRTTSAKDFLNLRRCHYSKGELMSPSEKISLLDFSRICDSLLGKIEEAMIWSEEEASLMQINQIGPSACGATAVLNVLNALSFPIPSVETLNECVKTKLRANTSPLTEYLLSRSDAGTDHNAIVAGLKKLSNNQIDARFFHMYPERVVNLYTWLAFWIKNGAVPIATLNLQKCVGNIPDAWHHQMIYGVGPKGIFLTNPLECVQAEHLWPQLCSEPVLLVRREDVVKRWNGKIDLPNLMKIKDQKWRHMNVVGQVANMIHEHNRELKQGFINTSHICIPASYSSGITIAIKIDAPAYPLLQQCPELPELNSYNLNSKNITAQQEYIN